LPHKKRTFRRDGESGPDYDQQAHRTLSRETVSQGADPLLLGSALYDIFKNSSQQKDLKECHNDPLSDQMFAETDLQVARLSK